MVEVVAAVEERLLAGAVHRVVRRARRPPAARSRSLVAMKLAILLVLCRSACADSVRPRTRTVDGLASEQRGSPAAMLCASQVQGQRC